MVHTDWSLFFGDLLSQILDQGRPKDCPDQHFKYFMIDSLGLCIPLCFHSWWVKLIPHLSFSPFMGCGHHPAGSPRLAQFFVAPLLKTDAAQRELEATPTRTGWIRMNFWLNDGYIWLYKIIVNGFCNIMMVTFFWVLEVGHFWGRKAMKASYLDGILGNGRDHDFNAVGVWLPNCWVIFSICTDWHGISHQQSWQSSTNFLKSARIYLVFEASMFLLWVYCFSLNPRFFWVTAPRHLKHLQLWKGRPGHVSGHRVRVPHHAELGWLAAGRPAGALRRSGLVGRCWPWL